MSKWVQVRNSFSRVHDDLFETARYSCEFFNYSGGSYDPDTGQVGGESRTSIGSTTVEIVPPAIDSTVDNQGTSFSWDTSIRFPIGTGSLTVSDTYTIPPGTTESYDSVTIESGATLTVNGELIAGTLTNNGTLNDNGSVIVLNASGTNTFSQSLTTLGEDNEKPTEVEISDEKSGSTTIYELHGYSVEKGSGMIMCRLVEQ